MISWTYPEFVTVTCLDWKPLLRDQSCKDTVINSMRFLVRDCRVHIYAFVLMDTHFHMIWQMIGDHQRKDVQRDFLRFTSQQLLKDMRNMQSPLLHDVVVNSKDRMRQIWERDSLSIELWSEKVFNQKLDYIHWNPVVAGLCKDPEDYRYSSAGFYLLNLETWDFLTHAG